ARDAERIAGGRAGDSAQRAARPRAGALERAFRKNRRSTDRVRDCLSRGAGGGFLARARLHLGARSGGGHAGARPPVTRTWCPASPDLVRSSRTPRTRRPLAHLDVVDWRVGELVQSSRTEFAILQLTDSKTAL